MPAAHRQPAHMIALSAWLLAVSPLPEMVRIRPGVFSAGSTPHETRTAGYPDELARHEQPLRRVRIRAGFAIMRTEVTRGAFARFAAATGWKPDGPCSHLVDGPGNRWSAEWSTNWRNPGFVQDDRHPVVCVSLADAKAYAKWLSTETGRRFRLPTCDEWEYAARAGARGPRWWSGGAECGHANLSDRRRAQAHNGGSIDAARFFACDDGHVFTAPVGSYRPNRWGLHDMLGNVWEWTTDCVDSACVSAFDRGASWTNSPRYVRAATKHPERADARTTVLGFRLVEDLR